MEQVKATIRAGGVVLHEKLAASVRVGDRGELRGCLTAPEDSPIQVGETYRLRTDDGRSSVILVTGMSAGGEQRVLFTGLLPRG